ncbi:exodeoxyribonuclease III [Candidiatus Paracoxiella cheracis]|uniref:exodeoxyribonuclease III n=1 Tax=Candidiatus Paracoxiella cheracis TaxID=3405120 RepID=UPI003BF56286
MRVISANLNGIRAAARKGFFEWLKRQRADVVCLQETKAHMSVLDGEEFRPKGYHCYYFDAVKKGYSGVGIFCRCEPDKISTGLGWSAADDEGRYIQADFGELSVASLYMPSGTSGPERQDVKFDFLDRYMKILKKIHKSGRSFIICGDWNIVHKEIDIKNFKSNQKHSGCLPEEREWIDDVFTKVGFVDAFRVLNQKPDQYTWWSNRGRAYEKNVGWRIDYQIITPNLKNKVEKVSIYKTTRFSDHAPLIIDYDYKL